MIRILATIFDLLNYDTVMLFLNIKHTGCGSNPANDAIVNLINKAYRGRDGVEGWSDSRQLTVPIRCEWVCNG